MMRQLLKSPQKTLTDEKVVAVVVSLLLQVLAPHISIR